VAYLYDLNGNLIDNGEKIFIYNADNRLIEARDKVTNATIATFEYDIKVDELEKQHLTILPTIIMTIMIMSFM
jgi:hypothetical protein